MKNVLVTGGAGYKGVLLTDALLKLDCRVTVLDNFMYGYEPFLPLAAHPHCKVLKKDIRNIGDVDLKDYDFIYHLAAISGYPACEANPHSAHTINIDSTKNLVNMLSKDQILIYASTTSIYGKSGEEQDENSIPAPVSTYGVTKYRAETICMEHPNAISFRFATLFGSSPKMRCDLMLNDFAYKAVNERSLVLFDADSIRTFLHVKDAVLAYTMALNPDPMTGEIYNVGSETMNYSKRKIAQKIQEHIPVCEIIETSLEDPDKRNFIINFDKIQKLGFKPTITIEEGIKELLDLYRWYQPYSVFKTI